MRWAEHALVVLICLVSACSRPKATDRRLSSAREEPEVSELRYQGNNGTVTPAELAEDLGYLAPIRLNYVGSTVSGPQSVQACVTGDTDFGGAFNGAVIKLVAAKAPIRAVVGYYGIDEKRRTDFYVVEDSPVHEVRDLLGKKVSMNTLGAHTEFMLKEYLFRNHLTEEDTNDMNPFAGEAGTEPGR